MVAGRSRDVLGVAAGEAAAGKMADGKAGEEKPEKPQRAGAAGGEHNPSVAGYVGCSEPFFEPPGVGGVDWGENGRIWLSPGQVLGPDEPRARPVRPTGIRAHIASLPGRSRSLFVTSWPQQRPCFRREGRWASERGTELGVGLGVAVPEPLPPHRRRTSHKTHTRANSVRVTEQ